MRYHTVVQATVRRVRGEGAELAGQPLAKDDVVFMLDGAGNRDPAAFDHPEIFDIRRKLKMHLGFGYGMHRCLGVNLARIETIEFLDTFMNQIPLLDLAEVDYGSTWQPWGPRKLSVRLPARRGI